MLILHELLFNIATSNTIDDNNNSHHDEINANNDNSIFRCTNKSKQATECVKP